jgi:formate/nitrite transporter
MAWADRKVSTARLLRNWVWVYLGNFAGAAATAVAYWLTRRWEDAGGLPGATAMRFAIAKCSLPFMTAFALGTLCNALVCLAVWLCFSARSTADRILAIVFPITAFVALGFEHSVANMYFIPLGMLLRSEPAVLQAGGWTEEAVAAVGWAGLARNLVPVTLGNIAGGSLMVALVYWYVYLRGARTSGER